MQLVGLSDKLLDTIDMPIVSFESTGVLLYKNKKAINLNSSSILRINEDTIISFMSFAQIESKKASTQEIYDQVEILADDFENEIFELNIKFDSVEGHVHFLFKNISESINLKAQLTKNENIIEDHIEELTSANDILREQNELIKVSQEESRSGLRYGKLIQERVNSSDRDLKKLFPNSFSLYKPQNHIGGDLIWTKESKLGKMIGVIDCMGHGVPGAMLAMSVFNFFNAVESNAKFESATEFLARVVKIYYKSFFEFSEDSDFGDTFDVSLCIIDESSNLIRFRGIKRPIIIVRNGELIEYKGNRVSVSDSAAHDKLKREPWDIVWPYKKGDQLYMYTDGFADQFGGVRDKKYKYSNFKKLIQRISAQPMKFQKNSFETELIDWQNSCLKKVEQTDDITLLGIQL